jgi:hypothetical protein
VLATARSLRNSVGSLTGALGTSRPSGVRSTRPLRRETALMDILPALVDQYGAAASTLATEWYDDLRAKQGIRGRFKRRSRSRSRTRHPGARRLGARHGHRLPPSRR